MHEMSEVQGAEPWVVPLPFACCLCPLSGILPEEYEDECPVSRICSENTNEMLDTGHFSDLSRF